MLVHQSQDVSLNRLPIYRRRSRSLTILLQYLASVFQPTPEDFRLEKAIEDFATISLGGRPSIGSRASTFGGSYGAGCKKESTQQAVTVAFESCSTPAGAYTESIASGAGSTVSRSQDQKRIGYSRSATAPSVVRSSTSLKTGHSRRNDGGYCDYPEPGALVRHSAPREEAWDDAISVGPIDSVSQVSSRVPIRHDYVPRCERRDAHGEVRMRGQ